MLILANTTNIDWFVPEQAIIHVANNMREADIAELSASQRIDPEEGLRNSIKISDYASVLVIKNEIAGIFGLVRTQSLVADGVPWFLGTDVVDKYPLAFVKKTKKIVALMNDWCPELMNYVHEDNEKSIRYLKMMGFTVSKEAEPIGCDGGMFYKFNKGAEKCVTQLQH